MTKKIKDNESVKPLADMAKFFKNGFEIIDRLPFIYNHLPKLKPFREQFSEIEKQMPILDLPDNFNDLFAKNGWICHASLNQTILEESINLGQTGKLKDAHQLLVNSVDESYIDLILLRCRTREHFKQRLELLQLIKIEGLAERYYACIPLLLALIDGLANDISKHIGFFTENLELELFDSMTAHSSGLPFLKKIMNASRTKTNQKEINIPYRNGILHGRDLNFNNKEVASKCWWALTSLIDWADEKKIDKKPEDPISFTDILKRNQKTCEYSHRIDAWTKRPIYDSEYWQKQTIETLEKSSPEYNLLEFLHAWKNKQWGLMNNLLVHTINNRFATVIRLKEDYLPIQLVEFSIIDSEDETPAITLVTVQLTLIKNKIEFSKLYSIRMNYLDENGDLLLRNEKGGSWKILQLSISNLLFNTSI